MFNFLKSTGDYYEDRHLLYWLMRYNDNYEPKQLRIVNNELESNTLTSRVEVLRCSLSEETLYPFLGGNSNCFILCIPGPEKVYNFRGIEKQLNVRDDYLYVSVNRIIGTVIVHWDNAYYQDSKINAMELNGMQWVHYKVPFDNTMGEDIKGAENGRTLNLEMYDSDYSD